MRIKKIELVLIALTLAFACFTGGYFVGRKGTVNVVTLTPQQNESSAELAQTPTDSGTQIALPSEAATPEQTSTIEETPGFINETTDEPAQVGAPKGGDGRININTATHGELTDLPGIGDAIAGRIIDYREQHGPFSRIEDIRGVSGIGEKRFDAIKELITV